MDIYALLMLNATGIPAHGHQSDVSLHDATLSVRPADIAVAKQRRSAK
jgi:hypothetical protein